VAKAANPTVECLDSSRVCCNVKAVVVVEFGACLDWECRSRTLGPLTRVGLNVLLFLDLVTRCQPFLVAWCCLIGLLMSMSWCCLLVVF